jgi:hypothetical protein
MLKRTPLFFMIVMGLFAQPLLLQGAPIVRGTGDGALIDNDLTDLGDNGVEGSYVQPPVNFPADLGGFDARFFASSEQNFGGGENAFNVFDNVTGGGNNKWCCESVSAAVDGSGVHVGADFSNTLAAGSLGIVLNRFTLTSSNDTPGRDPDVWFIQGSNDGSNWTNIYSFTNDGGTTGAGVAGLWGTTRNQVLEFSVANGDFAAPIAFDQFRLFVDSTAGSGVFALSEIELFGEVVDTAVPEPSAIAAWAIIGVAGIGVAAYRRRQRKH